MSGHSKWKQIKHRKAASDAEKSKIFGKLARTIALEAKRAGGDATAPSLRAVIEKARSAHMPKENIERAIRTATESAQHLERVTYEMYGPGGVAIIIETLTSNRNRTAAELKHLLSTHGLSLASPGSAAWAFEKTADGWVAQQVTPVSEDAQKELGALLEALEEHDDVEDVFTNAGE